MIDAKRSGEFGILGAVHGRDRVGLWGHSEILEYPRPGLRGLSSDDREIVHDVADMVHARFDPFPSKIVDRLARRAKQQGAEVIGDDAVDLLRHPSVKRTQSCLDMCDGDLQLRRSQRARCRRVGVAVDKNRPRLLGQHDLLELLEHTARHGALAETVDAEIVGRRRDRELGEEQSRHRIVEMLPGVDKDLVQAGGSQGAAHRRSLDKLRARANDRKDHCHAVCLCSGLG